ncbi:MAG: hypothetical protein K2K85_03440 [Clostridia bacterium]|nr:hypothetical protein [Clostridia bacterium]
MTRGKVITAKVFIGIICSVLILGTIFMTTIVLIFKDGANRPDQIYTPYNNIPNICGDDCVYISENFFYENNLNIPTNIGFYSMRDLSNTSSVEGSTYLYYGRAKELAYSFETRSNKNEQLENCAILIKCDPVNIEKLQNKQKYDGYVYSVETKDFIKDNDSEVMVYSCTYVIDFKRNENTFKKCQLTMEIKIEHDKDMPTQMYKERSDKLFYSLLDNVVYRNV